MIFSARFSMRESAQLCHRLSIAFDSGIEVRKIWAGEAKRAHGLAKSRFEIISQAVNEGHSLSHAMAATGDYFPLLMRELTAVGEETGKIDAVYRQLADHFQQRLQMRRQFLATITWPMVQLCAAIAVIALLILILGIIRQMNPGVDIDILGFGLYGMRGLTIYFAFIAAVAAVIWLIVRAIARGLAWTRLIQYLVLQIPSLGKTVEKLCLARFVWTFYITLESGMEIRRAVRMSLKSTNHARYIDRAAEIDKAIMHGTSLTEAFGDARCFPRDFMDALAVGEQSGRLSQTMENLSRQYQDQSRAAMATLTTLAGFAIWIMIAAVIIFMIFRLFNFYLGTINNALNMR
jgi:type II secretory pathway component PulF